MPGDTPFAARHSDLTSTRTRAEPRPASWRERTNPTNERTWNESRERKERSPRGGSARHAAPRISNWPARAHLDARNARPRRGCAQKETPTDGATLYLRESRLRRRLVNRGRLKSRGKWTFSRHRDSRVSSRRAGASLAAIKHFITSNEFLIRDSSLYRTSDSSWLTRKRSLAENSDLDETLCEFSGREGFLTRYSEM